MPKCIARLQHALKSLVSIELNTEHHTLVKLSLVDHNAYCCLMRCIPAPPHSPAHPAHVRTLISRTLAPIYGCTASLVAVGRRPGRPLPRGACTQLACAFSGASGAHRPRPGFPGSHAAPAERTLFATELMRLYFGEHAARGSELPIVKVNSALEWDVRSPASRTLFVVPVQCPYSTSYGTSYNCFNA